VRQFLTSKPQLNDKVTKRQSWEKERCAAKQVLKCFTQKGADRSRSKPFLLSTFASLLLTPTAAVWF
jgi:hypothetical protein